VRPTAVFFEADGWLPLFRVLLRCEPFFPCFFCCENFRAHSLRGSSRGFTANPQWLFSAPARHPSAATSRLWLLTPGLSFERVFQVDFLPLQWRQTGSVADGTRVQGLSVPRAVSCALPPSPPILPISAILWPLHQALKNISPPPTLPCGLHVKTDCPFCRGPARHSPTSLPPKDLC